MNSSLVRNGAAAAAVLRRQARRLAGCALAGALLALPLPGGAVGVGGTGLQVVGPIDGLDALSVNTVPFATDTATIIVNGTAASAAALGLGMTARVDGTLPAAGTLSQASLVAVQRAARGPATYVGVGGTGWATTAPRLKVGVGGTGWQVAGMQVALGPVVVWTGASSLSGIAPGSTIDVYGAPDYDRSVIVASRIEVAAPEAGRDIEVVGAVGAPTPNGFTLGRLFVDTTTAQFQGLAQPLLPGTLVHVFGMQADDTGTLAYASVVAAQTTSGIPDGTATRLEGLIDDYMGPKQFSVRGQRVDAANAAVSGGKLTDLRSGLQVEVGGVVQNGVLIASLVEIEANGTALPEAEIEGRITGLALPGGIVIGSTTVLFDGSTRIKGATAGSLRVGWKAHAHGGRSGAAIIARELEVEPGDAGDEHQDD